VDPAIVAEWAKVVVGISAALGTVSTAVAWVVRRTVRAVLVTVVKEETAPIRKQIECMAETVNSLDSRVSRHFEVNGHEGEADPEDRYQPMRVLVLRTAKRVREHGRKLDDGQRWMQAHEAAHQSRRHDDNG
jgi:hypothetical protein